MTFEKKTKRNVEIIHIVDGTEIHALTVVLSQYFFSLKLFEPRFNVEHFSDKIPESNQTELHYCDEMGMMTELGMSKAKTMIEELFENYKIVEHNKAGLLQLKSKVLNELNEIRDNNTEEKEKEKKELRKELKRSYKSGEISAIQYQLALYDLNDIDFDAMNENFAKQQKIVGDNVSEYFQVVTNGILESFVSALIYDRPFFKKH